MQQTKFYSAVLIPLLFVFLWSTGFIGAKYGLPYAEPFTFLFVRMVIASALLYAATLFTRAQWPTRLVDYLHVAVVGICIHGVYLGGVFFAISRGLDAGISALIVSLQPLITVMLAITFLNETLDRRKALGIVIGLVGVVIVIMARGVGTDRIIPIGLLFCTFSLIGISAGTVYQKRFCKNISLLPAVCIQYLATAFFLLPAATTFETMQIQWNGHFIFALAWLVLVLSLGAVILLMLLIERGDASQVAGLFYLVPPFTAVEAWLLFNEQMSATAVFGIVLCVLGVALVIRSRKPEHAPARE